MKKVLLNLLLLLMMTIGAVAQSSTLTVNDGEETNSAVPICGYDADIYMKCEFVIPAADLVEMTYGTITSMKFYLAEPAEDSWDGANFQVFMKEVHSATINSFYGPTDATIVYDWLAEPARFQQTVEGLLK